MNRLLFILVLFVIAATTSGCGASGGETTVYPVGCLEQIKNTKCSDSWVALNRTTYKVLIEQQQVISWMPDVDLPPDSLHNCVVRDRENWKCEYRDSSAKLYMIDGSFREESQQKYITPVIRYVSSWRWWQLKLRLTNEI